MKNGFYTIMAAQFFSSLADNALLIAAIALLHDIAAPAWMTPLLKLFFVFFYVALAAFVGALADAMPKSRVMLMTNTIKFIGCFTLLAGMHPLLAYGIVGFGAAAYSPAKYGILTELLPPEKLVIANGWIEGTTVGSIILGTALGGWLILPRVVQSVLDLQLPLIHTRTQAALLFISGLYILAALLNLGIPDTGARYPRQPRHPARLLNDFAQCCLSLWRDPLGQISLAVTALFWGIGATLQFIILEWAEDALGMSLSEGAALQVIVSVGVAAGAIVAAIRIPLKRSLDVLPVGMLMGAALIAIAFYSRDIFPSEWSIALGPLHLPVSVLILNLFLLGVGILAGFFIVPMNALLQHRGHVLLSAGHSIAVQNFNENLSILVMLCLYAILIGLNVPIQAIIVIFGALICTVMWRVMRRR
ncbi:Major facilitator superfamily (MFS_1) transporter [Candidatus Glomeribacter gigasporarum BEG34]|uniref:Major facilitator superfamily (MFS_1) transporter n=1 Tax=Candidatus Glomeribacter gigasporarum BEG34 TaxID=1070319 RepID=G2J905_9BURK|nr:lysophospholipid transporter LplT [Candidatus Glomeribacter gigasporarum]CCD29252.1 Major facilitator superfamily (MFS_1) transporter [Candidatus Glomeribacter gigasporarum BEG34]